MVVSIRRAEWVLVDFELCRVTFTTILVQILFMGGVYTGVVVYSCVWGVVISVTQNENKVSHISGLA